MNKVLKTDHPVIATIEHFDNALESITEVAVINRISKEEDDLLAGIVDQLHNLRELFANRELEVADPEVAIHDLQNAGLRGITISRVLKDFYGVSLEDVRKMKEFSLLDRLDDTIIQ